MLKYFEFTRWREAREINWCILKLEFEYELGLAMQMDINTDTRFQGLCPIFIFILE